MLLARESAKNFEITVQIYFQSTDAIYPRLETMHLGSLFDLPLPNLSEFILSSAETHSAFKYIVTRFISDSNLLKLFSKDSSNFLKIFLS